METDRNKYYGVIYMTGFSLIRRGHSGKVTRNATVKFTYRCFLRALFFFWKPFKYFVFKLFSCLQIRIIDRITFCFIFSIPSSFLIVWWESNYSKFFWNFQEIIRQKVTIQGFSEIFRKSSGKNNRIEFIFSNAARKPR